MRKTILAALAVTAVLGLAACSDDQTSQTGNGGDSAVTQATSGQNDNQSDGDDQDDQFAFGETYDGPLRTTVSEPEDFTTSQYAQPEGGAAAWKVTVTYENTLDRPYPVSVLGVGGYSDNKKGTEVFDSGQGVGNAMETGELAPGTSAEVTYGFTGEPGADRKLVISSMDRSTSVTFTADGQS